MKRIPAYLGLAASALFWAADGYGWGGPLPGEELSAMKVDYREPISAFKPNPCEKLSAMLPESDAAISATLINDHLRISTLLPSSKANISGFLPEHREKIGVLREDMGHDELSSLLINPHEKLASFEVPFRDNIGAQFPTPPGD